LLLLLLLQRQQIKASTSDLLKESFTGVKVQAISAQQERKKEAPTRLFCSLSLSLSSPPFDLGFSRFSSGYQSRSHKKFPAEVTVRTEPSRKRDSNS
jgi:hypothetical protein